MISTPDRAVVMSLTSIKFMLALILLVVFVQKQKILVSAREKTLHS